MKQKKKTKKRVTKGKQNPNGVNQYTGPDPRQAAYLAFYLDPKSETYANSLQSALKAGYSQEYAESLRAQMPVWLSESLGDNRRVESAQKHIDEVLEIPILVQAMGAFGPLTKKIPTGKFKFVTKNGKRKKVQIYDEEPIMVYSTSIMREKNKVVEFILPALSPARYGKNSSPKQPGVIVPIQINITEDRDKYAA